MVCVNVCCRTNRATAAQPHHEPCDIVPALLGILHPHTIYSLSLSLSLSLQYDFWSSTPHSVLAAESKTNEEGKQPNTLTAVATTTIMDDTNTTDDAEAKERQEEIMRQRRKKAKDKRQNKPYPIDPARQFFRDAVRDRSRLGGNSEDVGYQRFVAQYVGREAEK